MFAFECPEHIRKAKVFWMFSGESKGTIEKKSLRVCSKNPAAFVEIAFIPKNEYFAIAFQKLPISLPILSWITEISLRNNEMTPNDDFGIFCYIYIHVLLLIIESYV